MIYLDHHATTPCDPAVLDAMLPWLTRDYANPHSTHSAGRTAADAVEQARADVAALIGATPAEIIFTSGATEANNLAIKGAARFAAQADATAAQADTQVDTPPPRRRLITAANEHKCVLESVADLAREGFGPHILPLLPDGAIEPETLTAALQTPTLLVTLMAAHNETGRLQDIPTLAALAHAAGAKFHSDIAQAAGRIPIDVRAWDIDLASISAHKLYGPKGIGALFVRRHPRMRVAPLFSGGGQERGLRSGTLPTPLVVGFGVACRLARLGMQAEQTRITALRDRLLARLHACIPGLALNGPLAPRLAGNLSLRFPGAEGGPPPNATTLIDACPGLAVSTGSACTAAAIAPSHALLALGLSAAQAAATLRLGIGRFTSAADIDAAVHMLADAYGAVTRKPAPASA